MGFLPPGNHFLRNRLLPVKKEQPDAGLMADNIQWLINPATGCKLILRLMLMAICCSMIAAFRSIL
jgi:hypothetical protein